MTISSLVPCPSSLFLGIDLGTSGCRGVVIDGEANQLAEHHVDLPLPRHHDAGIDQDANLWWQAMCEVITSLSGRVDANRLRAIAIDGTSGTVLLCNSRGQPLGPALMYNDSRATSELDRIAALAPRDVPVHSSSSGLAKIRWLLHHTRLPDDFQVLHQADWLAGQLCQRFDFSDSNNALKSGFDPVNHQWPGWIDQLVPHHALPRVYRPGEIVAQIDPGMADRFGLPASLQVVAGTTDSTAAVYATGIQQPGEAVTSLGSTLVMKILSTSPITDIATGVYSQPFADLWLVGGASNSGGAVLRHYFTDTEMKAMESQLNPATPTGLAYYPLPARGERFPVNDPEREPLLAPRPDNAVVFFQAMLEGMAAIEKQGYNTLRALGAPQLRSIRSVGGGAKNPAWQQIRAGLLQVPMPEVTHQDAAYGSALLAREGLRQISTRETA